MSTQPNSPDIAKRVPPEVLKHVHRSNRQEQLRAFALVAPVLAFIIIFFILPIGDMLNRSIYDPQVSNWLPATSEALREWDRQDLPDEEVYELLARDLVHRTEDRLIGRLALVVNYEVSGSRTPIMTTANILRNMDLNEIDSYKDTLTGIHPIWGEREIWSGLKTTSQSITLRHYLAGLDLEYDIDGNIVSTPEYRQIYVTLLVRTLWASAIIMGIALLLGYPVAYHLATSPPRVSNLLMILVLLPFWTALLVRTAAWIVLLQEQGVINSVLVGIGFLDDGSRIRMVHNMFGTIVAMTYIMLPFMILPIYAVMRRIPGDYVRAAQSLGAKPPRAFFTVYLPQTYPGVGAGCILVFILSIGFYITPALVGGRTGQFISRFVAYHIQTSLNWSLAAALAGIILLSILALYFIYSRIFGIQNVKVG